MGAILYLLLFIVAVTGWILNVASLVAMTGMSGLLVLRVIGIFIVPLGAILGFI